MSSKVAMRWVARLACGVLVLLLSLFLAGWISLRASLPPLDGSRVVPGLASVATVERDNLGVPTVVSSNRADAALALGFLHAQDRFFQMDLLRRHGAGELAELFGTNLLDHDRGVRVHDFRPLARATLGVLSEAERAVFEAYSMGVNNGLDALRVRPPEYLLLQARPRPWLPEDSILVAYSMFLTLQDSTGTEDYRRATLGQAFPAGFLDFLFPTGSDWDAPLDDQMLPVLPVPEPAVLDFRRDGAAAEARRLASQSEPIPGSNSWGVRGSESRHGAAILANDMHLDLGVPNIWYRTVMRWIDDTGAARRCVGVTLPGVPVLVVGSTGYLAWAFTNATLDTTDLIRLEFDPDDTTRYRTAQGWLPLERVRRTILVKGEEPVSLEFDRTVWGPVVRHGPRQDAYALDWVAHDVGSAIVSVLGLERCRTVDEALDWAPTCGVPAQNFLVGDRSGELAWTLIGRLPRRIGFTGRTPVDGSRLAVPAASANPWMDPSDYPRWRAQAGERLWTANNRMLGSSNYLVLGPWSADLGARARQVRDELRRLPSPADESDLFSLFHDDRALFLTPWHDLLVQSLQRGGARTNAAQWSNLLRQAEAWSGRAATQSVGYRCVRAFRLRVLDRLWEPVIEKVRSLDPDLTVDLARAETASWTVLQQRPEHLLNPRFPTYDALLDDAVNAVLADLDTPLSPLDASTWGRRNTVRIQHPLSLALPWLGRWLDMPDAQVPGDDHMPRIQSVRFGPSERLVVAPGFEELGLFNMPGGQSGHFLSPYFRAGHQDWVEARPRPLLPGDVRHRLILRPTGAGP